jgi:hypothetical protein
VDMLWSINVIEMEALKHQNSKNLIIKFGDVIFKLEEEIHNFASLT